MEKQANDTKVKKSSKRNWIILAVVVFLFIGLLGSGVESETPTTSQTTTEEPKSNEPTIAKIGQPAKDGAFEFTVKGISCNNASVGTNEYMTKQAQGQYCLLTVSVKNVGDKAQSLFSANQKLLNDSKQEFSADDVATMYASPNSSSWYSNINPGNTVEGTIVFDLPKDQTPVKAVLKDSAFSGGVEVSLQ